MWAEARLRVKGAKFEAPRLGLCFLLLGGRRQIFRLHLVIIPRDGGAMRPPIFPPQTIGDTPQQYLHRARMFRDAAMQLPDYVNSEPNWPRYALLMHAIELALKAYARHFYPDGIPAGIEPKQHDLTGWYELALKHGFQDEPEIAANIDVLNDLHRSHFSRYPQSRSSPLPAVETIIDTTVDHLIETFTCTINPRY